MFRLKASQTTLLAACLTLVLLTTFSVREWSSSTNPSLLGRRISADDSVSYDVFNKSLGFQKILVISLPSRTDHRDALSLGSAFTGLSLEYVDGVLGDHVIDKVLPPGAELLERLGNRGSWRGHMNAIQRIVDEGLETALIMEDDVDWDIRIKDQMYQFAQGVGHLQQFQSGRPSATSSRTKQSPSMMDRIQSVSSPYGYDWDVLWLGHCGARFPNTNDDPHLPQSRVALFDDATVPESQHITVAYGSDELQSQYPNHTRVYHHTAENVCSLAYAVTQKAARQILFQLALERLTGPVDIALRNYCDGQHGSRVHACYTVQPALFDHHRAVGSRNRYSDINEHAADPETYNTEAHTYNIRWSTRMNLRRLVEGETDFEDQYPDAET